MEKKENNKSQIAKMWKDPKGHAILKLGIWAIFFLIMGSILGIINLFSNHQSIEQPSINNSFEFLDINSMWEELESNPYHYELQIRNLETQEITTYNGEVASKENIGYRESKLGIIKYKIKDEKTYQIFQDTEMEINNLWLEEAQKYVPLENLKTFLTISATETTEKENRTLTYQTENETIKIFTSPTKIVQIKIQNNLKELTYQLTY